MSGGQRQRITIARGLLKNSNIILLDEPTSALDVITEQKIMKQFKNLSDQGAYIIMSTHRISTISVADRIIMVKDQKLFENITLEEAKEYLVEGK